MKKLLLIIFIFIFSFSSTYSYNITDEESNTIKRIDEKLKKQAFKKDKNYFFDLKDKIINIIIKNPTQRNIRLSDVLINNINNILSNQKNIAISTAIYVIDIYNLKEVVGISDNVFVGKVINSKQVQSDPDNEKDDLDSPNTYFDIKVLYNIKGKLPSKTKVVYFGGKLKNGNYSITDARYPRKGEIILFVTSNAEIEKNVSFCSFNPTGTIYIGNDDGNTKELISNSDIVKIYRDAYKNEVYERSDDTGFIFSDSKNNYKYLSPKQKQHFEIFDNGFAK